GERRVATSPTIVQNNNQWSRPNSMCLFFFGKDATFCCMFFSPAKGALSVILLFRLGALGGKAPKLRKRLFSCGFCSCSCCPQALPGSFIQCGVDAFYNECVQFWCVGFLAPFHFFRRSLLKFLVYFWVVAVCCTCVSRGRLRPARLNEISSRELLWVSKDKTARSSAGRRVGRRRAVPAVARRNSPSLACVCGCVLPFAPLLRPSLVSLKENGSVSS
ncbi:unnamed protein product, partial [Scytosiphon promiscuus]